MKNPYDLLGVPTNASDDQIKEAYRALARKYQADQYGASPLSDIAAQRMKELDEAYDAIIHTRRDQGGGTGYRPAGAAAQGGSGYADIRTKLNDNRIDDAQTLLDGIPQQMRDAEWYFLKGTVLYRRGWLEEAIRDFDTACQMDPGNAEYRAARQQAASTTSGGYRTAPNRKAGGGCDTCDCCSALACFNCCCDGDCNPCC